MYDSLGQAIPARLAQPAASVQAAFALDVQDARLLTEIGFLAAGRGDVASADAIFGALRLLRPDRAYPWLGLAIARLNAARPDEAVSLLEQAHCGDPEESGLLQAWKGFALQLAGRLAQSRAVLEQAAAGPGDAAALARSLLGLPAGADSQHSHPTY